VRRSTAHDARYAYNFTVHGYSTPYWDWERWEREIDRLAANGFNRALVTVGYEEVLLETFARFGYTRDELRDWITLPAHQPWQWLGNLESIGPALSERHIEERAALGQRIADRMRELGIEPVVPGYYGLVPPGFAERNGSTHEVIEQGEWLGAARRPDLLNPARSEDFAPVASEHYVALERVFGDVRFFAADPFHEGGSTSGIDVPLGAANILRAMLEARPDAVWVLQAWLENPRDETLAGIQGVLGTDSQNALVIDLWGEELPAYRRFTSAGEVAFRGLPWISSIIQNFGGNTGIGGDLGAIAGRYGADGPFADAARGRLEGLGLTMEAIEHDSTVLELLSEMIWRSPEEGAIDLARWIAEYAKRRYGQDHASARAAWLALLGTVYSATPGVHQGVIQSILCARPDLRVESVTFGPRDPHYDPILLETALARLLEASTVLGEVDPYRHDVVHLTRQVLANRARHLLDEIREAFERGDRQELGRRASFFLELIQDQARLVATRSELRLGAWLQRARAWGASRAESDALERDARMILTTWLEADSLLHDYAHREWDGLLRDVYQARWRTYFAYLDARLAGEKAYPPDFFALEWGWVNETDPDATIYPPAPQGDPLAISEELFRKYVAPGTSAH
jgi:alpha-N-acetylglucosaminidase